MNLLCSIFNHKYRLERRITSTIRELKCTRCNREFSMSDDFRFVLPMDDELREAHEDLLELGRQRKEIYKS